MWHSNRNSRMDKQNRNSGQPCLICPVIAIAAIMLPTAVLAIFHGPTIMPCHVLCYIVESIVVLHIAVFTVVAAGNLRKVVRQSRAQTLIAS